MSDLTSFELYVRKKAEEAQRNRQNERTHDVKITQENAFSDLSSPLGPLPPLRLPSGNDKQQKIEDSFRNLVQRASQAISHRPMGYYDGQVVEKSKISRPTLQTTSHEVLSGSFASPRPAPPMPSIMCSEDTDSRYARIAAQTRLYTAEDARKRRNGGDLKKRNMLLRGSTRDGKQPQQHPAGVVVSRDLQLATKKEETLAVVQSKDEPPAPAHPVRSIKEQVEDFKRETLPHLFDPKMKQTAEFKRHINLMDLEKIGYDRQQRRLRAKQQHRDDRICDWMGKIPWEVTEDVNVGLLYGVWSSSELGWVPKIQHRRWGYQTY